MAADESRELLRNAWTSILPTLLLAVGVTLYAGRELALGPLYVPKTLVLMAVGIVLLMYGLREHHPFARLGPANVVTIARGALVALLAGCIGEAHAPGWPLFLAGILAAALDAIDGRLARRSGLASDFGARLDMETDALLILALAVLAWQLDKAGPWIVGAGLMRYAFMLAGMARPWLRAPLPPSMRRKTVAALQMVALLVVIAPVVPGYVAAPLAAAALALLLLSFAVDSAWLWRHARRPAPAQPQPSGHA